MKPTLLLWSVVLCVSVNPVAHAESLSGTAPALRGGIPEALPGFEVINGGELAVNDPAKRRITDCVLTSLKMPILWTAYPPGRLMHMLGKQELDLIYPMGLTDERNNLLAASSYTWQTRSYRLVRQGVNINDKNIRVGVRLNSPQHSDIKAEGYKNILTSTDGSLLRRLSLEQIDMAVIPETEYIENKATLPKGMNSTESNVRGAGFYLHKDDPQGLRSRLNASVEKCRNR